MTPSYRIAWILFRLMFASYFRWRVFHPERVPPSGAVILACNHASYLDPPLVGSGLRRQVIMLARSTLFRFPVFGAILRSWRAMPVDRDGGTASGLKSILDALGAGSAVLLFPEGTRTRDNRLQPAEAGIGLVAIKTGAPVVPVRVFGTDRAYGRNHRFPRPHRVAVKYGELLRFEALRAEAATCDKKRLKQIYQQVADAIMAAIAALEPRADG
jgi:1-acyl-sn-glycerol-3-phosphate acyltransferase